MNLIEIFTGKRQSKYFAESTPLSRGAGGVYKGQVADNQDCVGVIN